MEELAKLTPSMTTFQKKVSERIPPFPTKLVANLSPSSTRSLTVKNTCIVLIESQMKSSILHVLQRSLVVVEQRSTPINLAKTVSGRTAQQISVFDSLGILIRNSLPFVTHGTKRPLHTRESATVPEKRQINQTKCWGNGPRPSAEWSVQNRSNKLVHRQCE